MHTAITIIDAFKIFAEEQLHHHFRDIDTSYYNRELKTWKLEDDTYKKHRERYGHEMEAKIQALPLHDNEELHKQLQELKGYYMDQLCFENFNKAF